MGLADNVVYALCTQRIVYQLPRRVKDDHVRVPQYYFPTRVDCENVVRHERKAVWD